MGPPPRRTLLEWIQDLGASSAEDPEDDPSWAGDRNGEPSEDDYDLGCLMLACFMTACLVAAAMLVAFAMGR